ncbi:MAG TPA: hypothetical protein VEI07_00240 [Planctomycetaceae bacterium]|nr:hypothetical protein [Planctomycetaceae bacterium]
MTASIFLARLLGPMYLVLSVALFLKPQMFRTVLRDFTASPALMYLGGFFGLLGGMALILVHNVWSLDWRIVITLLGWIALVRALIAIFRSEWILKAGSVILEHRSIFLAAAVLNLLIGLILSFYGYSAQSPA